MNWKVINLLHFINDKTLIKWNKNVKVLIRNAYFKTQLKGFGEIEFISFHQLNCKNASFVKLAVDGPSKIYNYRMRLWEKYSLKIQQDII